MSHPETRISRLFSALKSAFGVNEMLFLVGFGALFQGIRGIWSLHGALVVCGALLITIAVGGVVFAERKGA